MLEYREVYSEQGDRRMSIKTTLARFFTNHAETRDYHEDKQLQTRYYKTTKDKGLQFLESYFINSNTFKLNALSKDHGEISVISTKGKKVFIVATVIMVSPFNTAIDFSVTTESIIPMDFGYSNRLIQRLYEDIGKELQLVD